MIKAILLDMGGVVIPYDYEIAFRQLSAICGRPAASIEEMI